MGSKDFNMFMDGYIDDIRSKKTSSTHVVSGKKKGKKHADEKVPEAVTADSVYVIKKPKTFWMKLIESVSGTDEEDFEEKEKKEKKESKESEQEFEQEYDEMEHEEEKKGLWARFCSLFSRDVNEAYEDIDDEEKVDKQEEKKENPEPTPDSEPEQEVEEEDDKPSIWQKLLNFFGIGIETEDYEDDEVPMQEVKPKEDPSMQKMIEMKEDLKDIAVIATAAFKKLPKEQFEMFKNSADFTKFKKLLEKHNVIKVKGKAE